MAEAINLVLKAEKKAAEKAKKEAAEKKKWAWIPSLIEFNDLYYFNIFENY